MEVNRTQALALTTLTLLMGTLLITSCSSKSTLAPGEMTTSMAYEEGVPGGIVVNTHQVTAEVTRVNKTRREVTLLRSDGTKTTFKAGPEVVNFDQIEVGDQVTITLMEEVVVFLKEPGLGSKYDAAMVMSSAPEGTKPGGFIADTVKVTAKVRSVNLKRHEATLQYPDGHVETYLVRSDVELSPAHVGREVVISLTEVIAVLVETP